jgi:hypothetical protein
MDDNLYIYLYSIFVLISFVIILVIINGYIEKDYEKMRLLLYKVNNKYRIFKDEDIKVMDIDKLNISLDEDSSDQETTTDTNSD